MLQRLLNAANNRITNLWPAKLNFGRLRAPIATISFDDFPHSAWKVGGRILESHGVRGTYFVSAAFSPDRLRNGATYGITPGVTYYELDDQLKPVEKPFPDRLQKSVGLIEDNCEPALTAAEQRAARHQPAQPMRAGQARSHAQLTFYDRQATHEQSSRWDRHRQHGFWDQRAGSRRS